MKNEYEVALDRNRYAPSVVPQVPGQCFICRRSDRPLQRHEPFRGPFRDKSKRLGCWVLICDECHRKLHNNDNELEREVRAIVQGWTMEHYGWTIQDFRDRFGKNYLKEDG